MPLRHAGRRVGVVADNLSVADHNAVTARHSPRQIGNHFFRVEDPMAEIGIVLGDDAQRPSGSGFADVDAGPPELSQNMRHGFLVGDAHAPFVMAQAIDDLRNYKRKPFGIALEEVGYVVAESEFFACERRVLIDHRDLRWCVGCRVGRSSWTEAKAPSILLAHPRSVCQRNAVSARGSTMHLDFVAPRRSRCADRRGGAFRHESVMTVQTGRSRVTQK